MNINSEEETVYSLISGDDNGNSCVKTGDLFVPCSSGEGMNLDDDGIVVKGEPRSSSGPPCTQREDIKNDITSGENKCEEKNSSLFLLDGKEEKPVVEEEHLPVKVKEEPSFEWPCDVKAIGNDEPNVENENEYIVVKDEPIDYEPIDCLYGEEEEVKPVIESECCTCTCADIDKVKTEPEFGGHFPDRGEKVKPKVEKFVKEEVSEWEDPEFGEIGKTEMWRRCVLSPCLLRIT